MFKNKKILIVSAVVLVVGVGAIFLFNPKKNSTLPSSKEAISGERYSTEPTGIDLIEKERLTGT